MNSAFALALLDSLNPCCPFSVTLAPMQLNLDILFVLIAPAISIAGFFVYRIQMGGSQRIFPIAKALCDVTATDDLDGGRGLSPMSGAAPEIGRQLIQAVACVFFRKSAVLLSQCIPCSFGNVLLVPIRSVKILRTCYFTHGHTSLMIHDKKSADKPIPGHQRTLLPYQHHGESARCL